MTKAVMYARESSREQEREAAGEHVHPTAETITALPAAERGHPLPRHLDVERRYATHSEVREPLARRRHRRTMAMVDREP